MPTRPEPRNEESHFGLHEVFFSTTDPRGLILNGNRVFVRVSRYSKEELVGQPHNIIRHPEMPRIVFKVLWDTIGAGRSITAYVKNIAKDGSFYWVLASVFPIQGGYLSIRIKPSSPILKIIPGLYQKALEAERLEGMDASLNVILRALQDLGFSGYDDFMGKALTTELKLVRAAIQEDEQKTRYEQVGVSFRKGELGSILTDVDMRSRDMREHFFRIFDQVEGYVELGKQVAGKVQFLVDLAESVNMHAINTSINAKQSGQVGISLAVIAEKLTRSTEKIQSEVEEIQKGAALILETVKGLDFEISSSVLQAHMIHVFAFELRQSLTQDKLDSAELADFQKNAAFLLDRIEESYRTASEKLAQLSHGFDRFSKHLDGVRKALMTLELTRKTGTIEASRLGTLGEKFWIVFDDMIDMLGGANDQMKEMGKAIEEINGQSSNLRSFQGSAISTLVELKKLLGQELRA